MLMLIDIKQIWKKVYNKNFRDDCSPLTTFLACFETAIWSAFIPESSTRTSSSLNEPNTEFIRARTVFKQAVSSRITAAWRAVRPLNYFFEILFRESKITFAVVVASHFFPILFSDELQKLSLSRFNNFVSPWKAAAIKHLPWSFDDSEITFSLWSPIISFTIYKLIFKLLDHVFFSDSHQRSTNNNRLAVRWSLIRIDLHQNVRKLQLEQRASLFVYRKCLLFACTSWLYCQQFVDGRIWQQSVKEFVHYYPALASTFQTYL